MMKAVVENGTVDDAMELGLVLSREWSAILDRLAVKEQIMQKRQDDGPRRKRGEREASTGSCQINPRGAEKRPKCSQLLRRCLAKCGGAAALEGSLVGQKFHQRPLEASGCGAAGPGHGCRSAG
jgi:hypothetical protein